VVDVVDVVVEDDSSVVVVVEGDIGLLVQTHFFSLSSLSSAKLGGQPSLAELREERERKKFIFGTATWSPRWWWWW